MIKKNGEIQSAQFIDVPDDQNDHASNMFESTSEKGETVEKPSDELMQKFKEIDNNNEIQDRASPNVLSVEYMQMPMTNYEFNLPSQNGSPTNVY